MVCGVGRTGHLKIENFTQSLGTLSDEKICEKNLFTMLVSEISLFVYILEQNSKWPPEFQKWSPVKFFVVSE